MRLRKLEEILFVLIWLLMRIIFLVLSKKG